LLAQRRPDGQVYVLLKGGHAETGSIVRDVLASAGGVRASFQRPRIAGPELRGTGCALATAIAVHWRGHDSLVEATQAAIGWLDEQRPRACPAVRSRAAAPRRQADERPVGVAAGEARREASSAPAWHLPISPDVQARVDAVLDVLRGETQPRPT
jgi:hypothetical protein